MMGLLGRIGRGFNHALENAAYNTLAPGLLGDALGPQPGSGLLSIGAAKPRAVGVGELPTEAPEVDVSGIPVTAPQANPTALAAPSIPGAGPLPADARMQAQAAANEKDARQFHPNPEQRHQMVGQYLGAMSNAFRTGDFNTPFRDYQLGVTSQIRSANEAAAQNEHKQILNMFQTELRDAGDDEDAQRSVALKYSTALPELQQYAGVFHATKPDKDMYVPVGDLGYLNKRTGDFKPIDGRGKALSVDQQAYEAYRAKFGDDTLAYKALMADKLQRQATQKNLNYEDIMLHLGDGTYSPAQDTLARQMWREAHRPAQWMVTGGQQKVVPPHIITAVSNNNRTIQTIRNTLADLKQHPDATGWKGLLPDILLNRMDPSGTDARAGVANIGSLQIHDRTGAVMTAAEAQRLLPFIPSAYDNYDTVVKKLTQLQEQVTNMNEDLAYSYDVSGKYVPLPSVDRTDRTAPPAKPTLATGPTTGAAPSPRLATGPPAPGAAPRGGGGNGPPVSQLKQGMVSDYGANGRWTLVNGKAVEVKNK